MVEKQRLRLDKGWDVEAMTIVMSIIHHKWS
jgi:hypothetical protein